jgi:mannosyltransferase
MKYSTPSRVWNEYVLLVLLTLLAAALRLYKLGDWSYFIDEMRTWADVLQAQTYFSRSLLHLNQHYAFSLITKLLLDIFGVNAISLRLFPCILGILSVPLLYFPIKHLFEKSVAFLAVFLIAVSPWHIYMSQMARWYTLLLLVMFFALLSFYLFVERSSLKYFLVYAILSSFSFTLHLTAFLVPIIAVVYLLLLLTLSRFRDSGINTKNLLIVLGLHGILGLATLPTFLNFLQQMRNDQELMGTFGRDFIIKALYHATPSVVMMAVIGLVGLWRPDDRRRLFLSAYLILPVIVLLGFLALQMSVSARYLFFTLPAITVAAGMAIAFLKSSPFKYNSLFAASLLAATVLPSLQSDYLYFTTEHGYRDRLKEAINYVKNEISRDDIVFVSSGFSAFDTRFYWTSVANLEGLQINEDQLVTSSWLESLDHGKRVWVITIGQLPGDSDRFFRWIAESTHLLAEFTAHRATQDQSIKVYLYDNDMMAGKQ